MMIALLLLLILLSICAGFYQLVKQQGRILLRLDALERGATTTDCDFHQDAVFEGLLSGASFPDFKLPDLSGKTRGLEDFKGKRLLLIHWDFKCGFCEAIADGLADFQTDLQKQNAQIVFLASGDASFNRERAADHGLKAELLLLEQREVPEPFVQQGTPVAYLLDARGQVAAPFASGADEVLALARRTARATAQPVEAELERRRLTSERSLAESRLERDGLKAGTRAPGFSLPDLQGRTVSLDDYRGQRVLLVFSDPNCGPCDELAPHLVRLHRQHRSDGLAVILVGRGSKEENRSKAEQFGFQFPVVIQDKWKLSKEYGIFATPVAFVIAENGVIAKDVAVGKDAILALAGDDAKAETKQEYRELAFDEVSRAVASSVSRRKMLGTVSAALGAAILATFGLQRTAFGAEQPDSKQFCPRGTTRCGANCCDRGQVCCGNKCCDRGQICCGNKCCDRGQICCGGKCCSEKAICLRGECCESRIVCAGRCCKEGERCIRGCCRRVISPNEP